mmetsp:Transcript_146519/g.470030  ORF Transcript_146519/g.470030 Transcript_146519/m.470030 type:complete len:289 (+) Transcript_146519:483-1349(+)
MSLTPALRAFFSSGVSSFFRSKMTSGSSTTGPISSSSSEDSFPSLSGFIAGAGFLMILILPILPGRLEMLLRVESTDSQSQVLDSSSLSSPSVLSFSICSCFSHFSTMALVSSITRGTSSSLPFTGSYSEFSSRTSFFCASMYSSRSSSSNSAWPSISSSSNSPMSSSSPYSAAKNSSNCAAEAANSAGGAVREEEAACRPSSPSASSSSSSAAFAFIAILSACMILKSARSGRLTFSAAVGPQSMNSSSSAASPPRMSSSPSSSISSYSSAQSSARSSAASSSFWAG